MRYAIFAAILGMAAWGAADLSSPASAASAFQWCPVGRLGWGEAGAPSCGFSSYDQCVAASGGVCTQNPFYTGSTLAAPEARQRRSAR